MEAFKNANNLYTNSICEASDCFIEKGDKNLINNVPEKFVRQTENRLLENTSSKKLIQIKNIDNKNNYHSNREPPIMSRLNNKNSDYLNLNRSKIKSQKKDFFKTKIISEEENFIVGTESYKATKIKENEEEDVRINNFIDNKFEKSISKESTHIREYEKIAFKNDFNNNENNENTVGCFHLDLNKNTIKTNHAPNNTNRVNAPDKGIINLASELMLKNKNLSNNDLIDFGNFSCCENSKRETEKNPFEHLTPKEKCQKKLLTYSKKGDKESFLKTLSELYALESEKLDIHFTNELGKNCLHIACEEGNLRIVEILLKLNFDFKLKVKDKLSKKTALHISCENGYFDISKMLIDNGDQINSLDADLNTPLHLCALNNHTELFQYLLEKSSNFNIEAAKNSNRETAFDLALTSDKKNNDNNNKEIQDKFNKIINDYFKKISDANNANKFVFVNNKQKNIIYEQPSPSNLQIKQNINSTNLNKNSSNSNNSKTSQFITSVKSNNNSDSKKNDKFNIDNNVSSIKEKQPKLLNSNKNSSKELSDNSKFINLFNSSNLISDLSTNSLNFSKKESYNISNSQFSNYYSNFNCYAQNTQRMSSSKKNID